MHKGHMAQTRQHKTSPLTVPDGYATINPGPVEPPPKLTGCTTQIIKGDHYTGRISTDQPGPLPTSQSGNKYIMISINHDTNVIDAEPMPSKSAQSLINAYKLTQNYFAAKGYKPEYHRLDNECPEEFKAYMTSIGETYQLAPAGCHRRNAAERAIRTFKDHFISILCGTDPDFPIYLWDRLLPQTLLTLNLMRASRINPSISA